MGEKDDSEDVEVVTDAKWIPLGSLQSYLSILASRRSLAETAITLS